MTVQIATRVDEREAATFKLYAQRLGTTPADALRMFIAAFNEHRGFPFEIRLEGPAVEPFRTEEEASDFSDYLAMRMMGDAR